MHINHHGFAFISVAKRSGETKRWKLSAGAMEPGEGAPIKFIGRNKSKEEKKVGEMLISLEIRREVRRKMLSGGVAASSRIMRNTKIVLGKLKLLLISLNISGLKSIITSHCTAPCAIKKFACTPLSPRYVENSPRKLYRRKASRDLFRLSVQWACWLSHREIVIARKIGKFLRPIFKLEFLRIA